MQPALRVLLVEDNEDDAILIARQLGTTDWRRVDSEASLRSALRERWDVVIVDHALPLIDAPQALRVIQDAAPLTPAFVVTGAPEDADRVAAAAQAGAAGYFSKNWLAPLPNAIAHAISDVRSIDQFIDGLARMLERRDKETRGHSDRVTGMTVAFAAALGITGAALIHIRRGAKLHDIGKMVVPDRILQKAGPLTDDERALMMRHPADAYDLLVGVDALRPALDVPYCHHEHWDGTGYPRGLAGDAIPFAARIFAVCDVWDALRSERPYKGAVDVPTALAEIRNGSGRSFDPGLATAFCRLIETGQL